MGKKGYVNTTAYPERIMGSDVENIQDLIHYARQQLGCRIPFGKGERAGFGKWMEDEAAAHGWSVDDLVAAVMFCKDRSIRLNHIKGLLYYVDEATGYRAQEEGRNLALLVSEALNQEQDPAWVRKLSLAQGRSLELVYDQWKRSHAHAV